MNRSVSNAILALLLALSTSASAQKPAARLGDSTSGGGAIVTGAPSVLINNSPAARVGDQAVTPLIIGTVPCVGGPIVTGNPRVIIQGSPAARVGDLVDTVCAPETIVTGSPDVLIGD